MKALCAVVLAALVMVTVASIPPQGIGNYIEINPAIKGKLFYWLFPAQNPSNDTPLILWMTGGPGCSGALAALYENGPYSVNEFVQLVPNPYSWNLNAHVMYIDQPLGTGFSTVESPRDYVTNETEVADDVYTFLQMFFAGPGSAYANSPFFVSAESYGGHYSVSVSSRIIQGNANAANAYINFKGVSCGNGMTAAIYQMPSYLSYATTYNLVDKAVLDKVALMTDACEKDLHAQDYTAGYDTCLPIINEVLQAAKINPYNRDLPCPPQFPLCYNLTAQQDYMNLPAVQAHLGVNKVWEPCNDAVNGAFTADWVENFAGDLVTILEAGYPALWYNGQLDFICNYQGNEALLADLQWSGAAGFAAAPYLPWYIDGVEVGQVKSYGGLTFVLVAQAGHMVPHDQPQAALEIITHLIGDMNAPWNVTSSGL
eukprot:c21142_g1_i1.p1 GENE.c21142_g1_i1~~c21142_g1_i1.p1  ORF type:complete len:440 (+),score=109.41 c21142_g1_i1:39-1322(+)